MMVELHHTIVADVAVRGPHWSENVACLAKLKLEHHRRMCLIDLQEEHTSLTRHIQVFVG